jgi:hypothetical protein
MDGTPVIYMENMTVIKRIRVLGKLTVIYHKTNMCRKAFV